ncbi:MAG TPA: long-chain fatty acid--CoA ligase [Steroidobacteraceae bacterium]|nr:long-chain fatty acid--CoA ligase [Steroidobacteraceae bacterium]
MNGLMQHWPLTTTTILRHAMREHGGREVVTRSIEGEIRRYGYADLHRRALQVVHALQASGVVRGERVATLAWNTDRHMEIWYGVMGFGAICHTINPRLPAEQLAYIINHAQDRILFIEAAFLPLLAPLRARLPSLREVIVLTDPGEACVLSPAPVLYEHWLTRGGGGHGAWPDLPEETAATLCYTSGTTGHPKGALYSHRSNVLHALAINTADGFGLRTRDVVLPIVPMFHANAWGTIFAAPMAGAKLVLPGCRLDGASLWELMESERVSVTAAVPTVWLGLLRYLDETGRRLPHLQRVLIGGSAVPRVMVERFERDFGVEVTHAWGMTEMSPVGTFGSSKFADPEKDEEAYMSRKLKQGRVPYTVELKVVDESGEELPRDGHSQGEVKVRGPAIVGRYFGEANEATDAQGWFATGDVATMDSQGYLQIVDRSKDVIKSGGEWISSIALENTAMGHPQVAEAAVIAVPHEKWGERPLLLVVAKDPGLEPQSVLEYVQERVAKWWVPDRVQLVSEIPHSGTGKIRKDLLRQRYGGPVGKCAGDLTGE